MAESNQSSKEAGSNQFNYTPISPEEQRAKQKQVIRGAVTLVAMIVVFVIIVVGFISYSVGYDAGKKSSKSNSASAKSAGSEKSNTAQSSDDDSNSGISGEASEYQSPGKVGEGKIPDHFRGKDGAKVVAIEYADFTCPYCVRLATNLISVHDKYDKKVQFIYRHYNVGHTYSEVTSKIAEAAYLVGGEDAFWKAADQMYRDSTWMAGEYMNTDQLQDKIRQLADKVGLDSGAVVDKYNDSANNGIDEKIKRDRQLAQDSSVAGTPTWFINKKKVNSSAAAITSTLEELTK